MEAGKTRLAGTEVKVDLISAMVKAGDSSVSDADVADIERSACPTCGSCSGMFTANSMNCLTEALGLSLPGNGTLLATHADRERLFRQAGRTVVDLAAGTTTKDERLRPAAGRSPTSGAFTNAMALDIAMGGSTNTVLHILAAAHEGGIDFTMADIDALSRRVPNICKVAPATEPYHVEDVHRAGGIPAILGELDRAGLIDTDSAHRALVLDSGRRPRRVGHRAARRAPRRPASSGGPGPPASPPRSPSARARAGRRSTTTASTAASGRSTTPTPRKAASPCSHGNVAARRLHREDGRRRRGDLPLHRPGPRLREPGRRRRGHPRRARSSPATSWSSATRDPRAGPACRRCCTRPRTSRAAASGRPAPCSPTAASPAARRASRSATSRPRRPRAASSGWSATAIRSSSTSRPGRSPSTCPTTSWPGAATNEEARGADAWTPYDRERQVSLALQAYAAFTTSAARGAVRDISQIRRA